MTGCAVLELVRLTGVTQIPRFKRKNLIGYVEYWNAGCGESRMSGVRREARCGIPAGGRRNERRDSWVISLPGCES